MVMKFRIPKNARNFLKIYATISFPRSSMLSRNSIANNNNNNTASLSSSLCHTVCPFYKIRNYIHMFFFIDFDNTSQFFAVKPTDKTVKLRSTDRFKITLYPQMLQLNQYSDNRMGRTTRKPGFDY